MNFPDSVVQVFAKAPEPGKVKTRLAPLLGETRAAEVQAGLVSRLLQMLQACNLSPVQLWCAPDASHPFFRECHQHYKVSLATQCRGDLGARMQHALTAGLVDCSSVVLVGSDCPDMTAEDISEAFAALKQDCDAVIGPAADGGYYLIGMKSIIPGVFVDIPWSTEDVYGITCERLTRAGLDWHSLEMRRDLDRPADYSFYAQSGLVS